MLGSALAAPRSDGWTLRVELSAADSLDPAFASTWPAWQVEYATCLKLVNHAWRDHRLVAEAAPWPRISRNGRTYTFDVRPRFTRFSNGERVTATSFARQISRLDKETGSPGQTLRADIVFLRARGSALSIRLRRPAYDLLHRLATPYFCAISRVHPRRARYPEGTIPSAGPYYLSRADGSEVILRRNPHYRGSRPRRPKTIELYGESGPAALDRVESGGVDVAANVQLPAGRRPVTSRVRNVPLPGVVVLLFGTGPGKPFANLSFRKAAALAVDRSGVAGRRGVATDALMPAATRGFRRARAYPLRPTPGSLERARRLAQGLVPVSVYGRGSIYPHELEFGASLKAIGINVGFRRTADCDQGADFYVALIPRQYDDPASVLRFLAQEELKVGCYWPWSFDTSWRPRLHRALRLRGRARLRALSSLESELVRERVVAVGLYEPRASWLVSARIGCFRPHPVYQVDLGALCLRR